MSQAKINDFLKERMEIICGLAKVVGNDFKGTDVSQLKEEFKNIKSWMAFVKLQKDDSSMKMNDKCKKIYNTISVINDALQRLAETADETTNEVLHLKKVLENAKDDWGKVYSEQVLHKLEKQLVEYQYNQIQPELIENFLLSYWKMRLDAKSVTA